MRAPNAYLAMENRAWAKGVAPRPKTETTNTGRRGSLVEVGPPPRLSRGSPAEKAASALTRNGETRREVGLLHP
jgi:hypothetical protein